MGWVEGHEKSSFGEEGEGNRREKAEVKLEVKMSKSLGWLQRHLPGIAWKNGM